MPAKLPMVEWLVPTYNRGPDGQTQQVGDSLEVFAEQCARCRRLRLNLSCAAFGGPIPEPILRGEHDHSTTAFPGDNGLLRDPLPEGEPHELQWVDDP